MTHFAADTVQRLPLAQRCPRSTLQWTLASGHARKKSMFCVTAIYFWDDDSSPTAQVINTGEQFIKQRMGVRFLNPYFWVLVCVQNIWSCGVSV